MSGECQKCNEHCLDCKCEHKWLCAECFKQKYKPNEDFDWRTVSFVPMRCEKCRDEPVVFTHPKVTGHLNCALYGELSEEQKALTDYLLDKLNEIYSKVEIDQKFDI